jgi:hypothetical protein
METKRVAETVQLCPLPARSKLCVRVDDHSCTVLNQKSLVVLENYKNCELECEIISFRLF